MREEGLSLLGEGVYSVSEAAKLSGIRYSSIRRWVLGYRHRHAGAESFSPPIFEPDLAPADSAVALSFADLIEVRFIHAFREEGVSLQSIRVAASRARDLLDRKHPFSTRRFMTDGATIFAEIAKESDEPELLDLVRSQMAFKRILQPYLRGLQFTPDDFVALWYPLDGSKRVVIDPKRSFGAPIVQRGGVRTEILYRSYVAEESAQLVARTYELDERDVRDAIRYEELLAA